MPVPKIKLPVNAAARKEVTSWKRAGTKRMAITELITPRTRIQIVVIGPGLDGCGMAGCPFINKS